MNPLRLALVGAGSMAANHARVITESDQALVALVVDRDADRAKKLAHEFGATATTDIYTGFQM